MFNWFKKEAQLLPSTLSYFPSSLKETLGGISSKVKEYGKEAIRPDTSFLQGISRRTKPQAEITSSAASLGEYLKTHLPQSSYPYSYPSQQTIEQPILNAMQSKITTEDQTAPPLPPPVKEATQTAPQTPFPARMPDPAKTIYSQDITKRGVYKEAKDEFGNVTRTFLRENEPGDIFEGKEIYTFQGEWRDLSTEFLQHKGELYFQPPQDYLNRLQERLKS